MIKKIYCLLLLIFLSSFGYANQKTLSIENNRLVWDYAGSLPAQKGFDKNIGTAGLLQGIIGDYIVVGGGANFPEALEKGGKKVTHKDLYLLKDVNGKLKTIEQIQLDYPIAYGASVSVKEENAIYYTVEIDEEDKGIYLKKTKIYYNYFKYDFCSKESEDTRNLVISKEGVRVEIIFDKKWR